MTNDSTRRSWGLCPALRSVQGGFSYVLVLALVAALGFGLAKAATVWSTMVAREREAELLFAGRQFQDALTRYARESPAGAPKYPKTLEELLLDTRYPSVRRHLRRVYVDPITGTSKWGLIRQQDRIVGVYSLAKGAPVIRAGFAKELAGFGEAKSYGDWRFIAEGVNLETVDAASRPKPAASAEPIRKPAPVAEQEAPPIPNPPMPCTAELNRAVELCWSDRNTNGQNAECEAQSQNVYNACMRARLTGGR